MSGLSLKSIQPLAGYVLVEPAEAESQTKSGIILTSGSEEKPQVGIIRAVGDAAYIDGQEIVCPVKKGDHVLYKKWGGTEVKADNKEVQVLKFEDLIAIVK